MSKTFIVYIHESRGGMFTRRVQAASEGEAQKLISRWCLNNQPYRGAWTPGRITAV